MQQDHLLTRSLRVLAISPGVAIGPVRLYGAASSTTEMTKIGTDQVEAEQQRLHDALTAAIHELGELGGRVAQTVGRNEADIFAAQQLMLQDPDLLAETQALITQQHFSAASALHQAAEHQAQELEALENEVLAARSSDIRDATARAVRLLREETFAFDIGGEDNTPALIVANDRTPSDTATLDPRTILGICTVVGGPTTHAAIIARALEIPAVAGIDPQLLNVLHDGAQIAIDGTRGLLYQYLNDEQQREFSALMRLEQEERAILRVQNEARWRTRPASTADGVKVQVFANVGDVESARVAAEAGAERIGLLRTEFLFGGRLIFPDEQEQFESYVALFRAFAEHVGVMNQAPTKTIIARTLDAGADKPFPALEPLIGVLQEANPALGLRGARIHLAHEELLRQQLRALLRAGIETGIQLHIMFPMITTLEEIRRLRAVYESVRQKLAGEGVMLLPGSQIGIMVEI